MARIASGLSGAASGATAGAAFGPWGAAIGGVLGGAAGLLGGGSGTPGPGLAGLVRKARRQGLHPLTVLGSPIAGNFATPSNRTDIGTALGQLGEAGAAIGANWQARKDKAEADNRLRRRDDLEAQETVARIGLMNAQASDLLTQGMGGPRAHTSAAQSNSIRPLGLPPGLPNAAGSGNTRRQVNTAAGNWEVFGDWVPDADWWEQRYGDPASWVAGALTGAADIAGNLGISAGEDAMRIAPFLPDWPVYTGRPGPGDYNETFVP